jgi:hypothetical protein
VGIGAAARFGSALCCSSRGGRGRFAALFSDTDDLRAPPPGFAFPITGFFESDKRRYFLGAAAGAFGSFLERRGLGFLAKS